MATLAEVAKYAGVSVATVSKVLSGTPYFTEETRQKVMEAVDALGYVPNLAARALSSGKTHIIAVVLPHVYDSFTTDPLTLHILEGIEAEVSARGYNLLLSTPRLSTKGPDETYRRLLRSGYVDGLVAFDNVPMTSVLKNVRTFDLPAVSIGYGPHPYYVRSNDKQGCRLLMHHLAELGHRHIGLLSVPADLHISIPQRLDGLREMAEEVGLDFDSFPLDEGDFSINSGRKGARWLLKNHPNITAIIGMNDRMAIGALQEAHQQGLNVPHDLSIVGYDDIPMAALVEPALTTISQRGPELGHMAAQMLFDIFDGAAPDSIVLDTDLMIRRSSAPPEC